MIGNMSEKINDNRATIKEGVNKAMEKLEEKANGDWKKMMQEQTERNKGITQPVEPERLD